MYVIKTLSNGIKLIMEDITTLKSVSMGVYVKTGSKYETEKEHGVSHLLEHMLFKGTEKRRAKDISEEIDNIGGNINAFTSKEITSYYVTVLDNYVPVAADVLSDMFLNSAFVNEELEKEKNVVIEEIKMYEDVPEEHVHDINSEFVFDGCKLASSILGTEASLKEISRDILNNYHKERYVPENTIISVAGNINFDKVYGIMEEKFGKYTRTAEKRVTENKILMRSGEKLVHKETNQIHLCLNTKGVSYLDESKYAQSIISNVLGGSMSSRLFQEIREERGLAYSVYSYLSTYEEGGMFTVYAGTTKDSYREVIDLTKKEFEKIKRDGISDFELTKSKNQLISGMILGLETSKSRMSRIANSYLNHEKIVPVEDITTKIEAITKNDIIEHSRKVFDEALYSVTVLGDIESK